MNKPGKLNISKNFKTKLESLYSKNSSNQMPKILQHEVPVKNVFIKPIEISKGQETCNRNQFNRNTIITEKVTEIEQHSIKNKIVITIEIESYRQLLHYTFIFIFSICLSIRISYLLFIL